MIGNGFLLTFLPLPISKSKKSGNRKIASRWYAKGIQRLADKQIDLLDDSVKVALFTNAYTPNFTTHEFYPSLTNEATGTGYTAGGKVLTGKMFVDNTYDQLVFSAANTVWTGLTTAFRYLVLFDDTAAGKPLIACIDMTTTRTVTAQDLTVVWQYSGLNPETGESEMVPGILVVNY